MGDYRVASRLRSPATRPRRTRCCPPSRRSNQLVGVTVVADAGMVSEANQRAVEAAGLSRRWPHRSPDRRRCGTARPTDGPSATTRSPTDPPTRPPPRRAPGPACPAPAVSALRPPSAPRARPRRAPNRGARYRVPRAERSARSAPPSPPTRPAPSACTPRRQTRTPFSAQIQAVRTAATPQNTGFPSATPVILSQVRTARKGMSELCAQILEVPAWRAQTAASCCAGP
jgi:hypothetical protein